MPQEAFLPRAEIEKLQFEQLGLLLEEVLATNAFYRRKFEQARLTRQEIQSFADLKRLPFTTKPELQADQQANPPYGSTLTYPPEAYQRLHQTSGSTGSPLRWLDTTESWQALVDCWLRIFDMVGVEAGDHLLFPFSFGPFLGFWSAFEAGWQRGCLCLPAGGLSSVARLRMLLDNRANYVLTTPTYALRLAEVARQENIELSAATPGYEVRGLIVAGEPGGSIPATRRRIEEAWNARVFDHSGMTEVGPLSVECPPAPGGLHVLESHYWIEIVDPATGGDVEPGVVGELVVTTLRRRANPLIRYRTGDLVRLAPQGCRCGRSFAWLEGGILGRADDMISVRGNNLFPSALEGLLRRFEEIAEFRVEVDASAALAELRVEIEPSRDTEQLAARVARAIRDELMFRAEVLVVAPGTLPRFEMKARRVIRKGKGEG